MDSKTLQSLRIGDTVTIHFTHYGMSADEARGRPFNVVIAGFNNLGRAYKSEDDGQYYESRQISWKWADMPVELQPYECTRDDIRGLDGCHEDHIVAIVSRAPYRSQPRPRNYLYAYEQSAYIDHLKVEAYRKAKGEDVDSMPWRRKKNATGYIYEGYNETYQQNIRSTQYNGHLYKLAEALLARRPQVVVTGRLDADRFYAAWNQAGRPGYAGPYRPTDFSSHMRNKDGERIDPSPYKALVNRKAFTNWVVRNAHRFVMTKAVNLKNMIQSAIDEEEYARKSMEDDFRRDYGQELGGIRSVDADEPDLEDDADELIASAQMEYDVMSDDS